MYNMLISGETLNRISDKIIQEKVKEGKVFSMPNGMFLIDEGGEYREYIISKEDSQ